MRKVRDAKIILENNMNEVSTQFYKEFIVLMKNIVEDINNNKDGK